MLLLILAFFLVKIGSEKPDPIAYQVMLQALELPAKEVIFVDDRLENIEAAQRLGLDAILFESTEQMRQELQQRAVL